MGPELLPVLLGDAGAVEIIQNRDRAFRHYLASSINVHVVYQLPCILTALWHVGW